MIVNYSIRPHQIDVESLSPEQVIIFEHFSHNDKWVSAPLSEELWSMSIDADSSYYCVLGENARLSPKAIWEMSDKTQPGIVTEPPTYSGDLSKTVWEETLACFYELKTWFMGIVVFLVGLMTYFTATPAFGRMLMLISVGIVFYHVLMRYTNFVALRSQYKKEKSEFDALPQDDLHLSWTI